MIQLAIAGQDWLYYLVDKCNPPLLVDTQGSYSTPESTAPAKKAQD